MNRAPSESLYTISAAGGPLSEALALLCQGADVSWVNPQAENRSPLIAASTHRSDVASVSTLWSPKAVSDFAPQRSLALLWPSSSSCSRTEHPPPSPTNRDALHCTMRQSTTGPSWLGSSFGEVRYSSRIDVRQGIVFRAALGSSDLHSRVCKVLCLRRRTSQGRLRSISPSRCNE